jgi:hypothetical protein
MVSEPPGNGPSPIMWSLAQSEAGRPRARAGPCQPEWPSRLRSD